MDENLRGRSPLERFPEHVRAIGMITIEMGTLEASCVHLLAAILRTTETVADAILTTPQSTRARLEIVKSVSDKLLREEDANKISTLMNKCDDALNKRNYIVHSVWGSDGTDVIVIPLPKGKIRKVTVQELLQQIDSLRRLADKVKELTNNLAFRPHYSVNITHNFSKSEV